MTVLWQSNDNVRRFIISIILILRICEIIQILYGFVPNRIAETDFEFRLNATTSRNVHQRRLNDASSVISKGNDDESVALGALDCNLLECGYNSTEMVRKMNLMMSTTFLRCARDKCTKT